MTARSRRLRSAMAGVVILAVLGVFVVRLVDIQVVRAAELDTKSTNARAVDSTIYGTRGSILDTNGVTLAGEVMRYTVQVSPAVAKTETRDDFDADVADIGRITGLGGDAVRKVIDNALADNPKSQYALITKNVDVATMQALDALGIPWLYMPKHYSRTYPNGAVAGNIIGFVGSDGKPLAGVEYGWNKCLQGSDGQETYQRSADGSGTAIPGSTVTTKPAKDGGDITLTLDADLQWFSQQTIEAAVKRLGATYGAVTIEEVKTGKLRTVAEYPSVDPNDVQATDPDNRGSRAFSSPFEPGSTFKAVTAASLLDTGYATPTTHVLAPYRFQSGHGADLHDAFWHQDLPLTLTGVLMESSNTGISILGSRMPDKARYEYMKKFGLGEPSAIGFPGESGGILSSYKDWGDQDKYATMFGQHIAITSIQLASIYQTLANGGVQVPVKLVEGCTHADGTVSDVPHSSSKRVVSKDTADKTVKMLESVVDKGEDKDLLTIPGYRVAAKTGTAQQPDGHGGYKSTFFVSVTGMAPVLDPQYVVSINIADPITITSSVAAAPVFRTIMEHVLQTYRIKPSTTKASDFPTSY